MFFHFKFILIIQFKKKYYPFISYVRIIFLFKCFRYTLISLIYQTIHFNLSFNYTVRVANIDFIWFFYIENVITRPIFFIIIMLDKDIPFLCHSQ